MSSSPTSSEQLWELFSRRLKSFFAHRVADQQAAEDLLQETFIRIHKGLGSLGEDQRMESWVFQIARNQVVDYRRRRKDVALEADQHDFTEPQHEGTGPDNLNSVVRDWLPAMIDQLPAPYEQAVRLFELEGIPQQEIANRLGISLSGAKSRIQRGREKLRAVLFECCSFERDRLGNVIGITSNDPTECDECDE